MCVCTCTCTQTGPVRHSEDIQNVCMYMYVYSDWSSETPRGSSERVYVLVRVLRLASGTFRTCVCPRTCSQIGPVEHSERVYVYVRVLRLVQWDIQNVCMSMYVFSDWSSGTFRTCVCPCTCSSDWSSETFRTCVCPCTCSQTGPVGHSECVYVHVRVLRLVQWDIQNEHIAGHYYEERLENENITKSFYIRARKLDSATKLYHNEYQCITSGAQTEVGTRFF